LRRRNFCILLSALAPAGIPLNTLTAGRSLFPEIITRNIPGSGQSIPVIGMGSWITFNVGNDQSLRNDRVKVLKAFFKLGGGLIDSSPMYGSSEEVIGYCLKQIGMSKALFSATKVWTPLRWHGVNQMETSLSLWGEETLDLIQVHNLLSWESHLDTLNYWKSKGRVRYIGVTTSHGSRHDLLARIISSQSIDFVQFTYNLLDRKAEEILLPLAAEKKVAVIINRPFQGGRLFDKFGEKPLPNWAAEFNCANWAQFFLKFIISHPSVTCTIPATSRVDHMGQNMGAGYGRLPDNGMRRKMVEYIENF